MKKKLLRTISSVTALCMLLVCMCGCETWDNFRKAFIDPKEENIPVIKIGVFEPLSGTDAKDAADEIAGIELANSMFSTVLDSRVELVYADNKSDTAYVPQAIEALKQENVSLMIGSYGNLLTLAAGDLIKDARIPSIAVTCTNPLITQANDFYSRVCYIDSFEAKGAADLVYFHMHLSKAGILYCSGNDYAKAKADEFFNQLKLESGSDEAMTISFTETETDFNYIFDSFEDAGVSVIYLPESRERSEALIQAAAGLGYNFTWIGTNLWEGIQEEGVYYTVDYDQSMRQSVMTEPFMEAYHKKYGNDKDPSEATALGFDAYLLALALLREAGAPDNGGLIAYKMQTITGLAGATGNITLDENGDPIKGIVVKQVINGSPVSIYTVTPGREQ